MKNSRKFVGDAIPLKEPDFTLERITLLRVIRSRIKSGSFNGMASPTNLREFFQV